MGVPAPCNATKGNCPLGGMDTHFDNVEDAQKYADSQNESEHGLLPGVSKDNVNKLPIVYSKDNGRIGDFEEFHIEIMMKDPTELKENIQNKHRVNITNLDNISEDEKKMLLVNLYDSTPRKIGNIVGFLESNKNTSYSKTKEYSRNTLEGNFEEVYPQLTVLSKVGWHKTSSQGQASERTSFNTLLDKKALNIATDIVSTSEVNKESENYPVSGMVASVQALRLKGWNESEIKNIAKTRRLDDVVYEQYKTKPREVSGATEMIRIMNNDLGEYESLDNKLTEVLKWDE